MNKILAQILFCICCCSTYATVLDDDSTVIKTRHIQEVTVEAKRIQDAVTSSKPLQTIDKEKIEQFGIANIADAVKRFAGTNVKDYGGIGGMKTVSIRNLGAHHTAVSYDGVTISNTQAGQIDLGRYSLDNVQSLSLAIGETEDVMQTARHIASAGVLSIETERPHFKSGQANAFRLKVKSGSFGLINPSFRYWQKLSSATSVAFNGDYMRADGMYPFTLVNGRERTREKRHNTDIYTWRGETNLFHNIKGGEVNVKAYWFYSERGLPGAVILYNNTARERLWDEDFFTQASLKKQLGENWLLRANAKYSHSWNKYEDTDVKYQNGKLTEINRQNEYYASATIGWKPCDWITVALAEDLAYNDLLSNLKNNQQPKRYTSLTALTTKLSARRINACANVTGTFITEKVETGDKPDDRKRLSPTLSLSYRLLPEEALYLRAMYKGTFRVPTFNDMYYERVGTKSLRPEKASEYNLGLTWQGKPLCFMKHISLTIDGYYNNVKDKIVAIPTMYVWKMTNYGRVRMYGINVAAATEVALPYNMSVALSANYSLQNSIDVTNKHDINYKSQVPYTPKNTGNGSLLINSPWVNIGYSVTACGERYSLLQNTKEYRLKSFWEHNITASHEFSLRKYRVNLQGTISNLTNRQYDIIRYYPMPGRAVYVQLRIDNL